MTWRELSVSHPEFVQWVVAWRGPLPEGLIEQSDYEFYATAYMERGES